MLLKIEILLTSFLSNTHSLLNAETSMLKGFLAPITLKIAENTGKFANKRFDEKKKEYVEPADANRFGFFSQLY